jgi:hypothetical protein
MSKIVIVFTFLIGSFFSMAQFQFDFKQSLPVIKAGNTLKMPWTGGLNYVQISQLDVDFDGDLDLFVFDRSSDQIRIFKQVEINNVKTYEFAPMAYLQFPTDLRYRVQILDYNQDGKNDIFTYGIGGMKVYKNIGNAQEGLKWELAKSLLYSDYNGSELNLYVSSSDIPAIVDVENDGDLDFIVGTWNASVKTDNKIYAYRAKDQKLLWTYAVNDVMYHGTAVGDLDKDGKQELVVGCYNDTLYCINAENGTTNWKYSFGNNFYVGGPALIADLNNDGRCEVVFSAWYKMAALTWDGKLFWEYNIPNYKQSFRGAAIADVNNNAFLDVVFGTDGGSVIGLNGQNGSLIFNKNLRTEYGDSLYAVDHAPLLADFDKDGKMDVFVAGGHAEYPNFYKNFGRAYLLTIGKGNGPDWLMFQNDIWRRSNICEKKTSSIENILVESNDIHIYPNPTFGETNFELTLKESAEVSIAIYNIQGQKISTMNAGILNAGKQTLQWKAAEGLASGLFYVEIKIGAATTFAKVLLQ